MIKLIFKVKSFPTEISNTITIPKRYYKETIKRRINLKSRSTHGYQSTLEKT